MGPEGARDQPQGCGGHGSSARHPLEVHAMAGAKTGGGSVMDQAHPVMLCGTAMPLQAWAPQGPCRVRKCAGVWPLSCAKSRLSMLCAMRPRQCARCALLYPRNKAAFAVHFALVLARGAGTTRTTAQQRPSSLVRHLFSQLDLLEGATRLQAASVWQHKHMQVQTFCLAASFTEWPTICTPAT